MVIHAWPKIVVVETVPAAQVATWFNSGKSEGVLGSQPIQS
jgi:hypothetical protein